MAHSSGHRHLPPRTVDKFGSPKSPMGWGLKRFENLIQDPLENPTTFLLFDELRPHWSADDDSQHQHIFGERPTFLFLFLPLQIQ
jgi:hypothetical protein